VKFRDTLNDTDRHFVERMEAFGDVVVGFSLSLLALQLVTPDSDADVFGNPLRYVLFFATFAIIAAFWMRFTRIMTIGFAPRPLDTVMLFTYLAFVALLPYSLQTLIRVGHGHLFASLALYLSVILGVTTTSLGLNIRGARNAWSVLDTVQRSKLWRSIIINFIGCISLASSLAFDLTNQPFASAGAILVMAAAMRVSKFFFTTPRPRLLGISDRTETA
jgi:uncharacterized membrane protein